MKVFVTGGSGWVGKHVVPELIAHGHKVLALARSNDAAKALEGQGAQVVRGTLEDIDILQSSAKDSDAVIHLAYIHDFANFAGKPAQVDFAAVKALCSALAGTNKPFVGTSGLVGLGGEQNETDKAGGGQRQESEDIAFSFTSKGLRPIVIRLAPCVHGDGDWGFIVFLTKIAKEKGHTAYIDKGDNEWVGVHVKDAAKLYRLVIENQSIPGGTALHAAEPKGLKFKQVSEIINKKLDLKEEPKSVSGDQAGEYFGFMKHFAGGNTQPKTQITKNLTGWELTEKTLEEDLETGTYFD
ncbi:uncharacterized protein IL334_005637 [Kwoniella shivajii]|uniref:NAD-dependent epimerase/dehydratase domain-containing protein n=1 Tax=Kwoniella shivajii TaxID=564305 RepID=A0ABZ1D407_9TREE|nr:hypothetical protein IL334_005637 [Kwoniella shivajii]